MYDVVNNDDTFHLTRGLRKQQTKLETWMHQNASQSLPAKLAKLVTASENALQAILKKYAAQLDIDVEPVARKAAEAEIKKAYREQIETLEFIRTSMI